MVLRGRDHAGAVALTSAAEWPELRLARWRDTKETLHRWLQIAGKIRLALTPPVNHWWHVPLYVCARGVTTSPIPWLQGEFELVFDFERHELAVESTWAEPLAVPLAPRPVADFHAQLFSALKEIGVDARIWPVPVEIPGDALRFTDDTLHREYEPEAARRLFEVLLRVDAALKRFRGGFLGKASPVHLFWGSFDLCSTRFSGRRAPPRPGADPVTAEAYSHEVWSAGWWPGGGGYEDAAFYSYAAPEPGGFSRARMVPEGAFYDSGLKEFLLPYETVRRAPDPDAAVAAFLETTYGAAAGLGGWDRDALERRNVAAR